METGSFALANTHLSVQRVDMASWEPGSAHPDTRARLRGVRSAVRFESAVPTRDAASKNAPLTTNGDPGVGFVRAPHISCVRRATTVGQGISDKRRRSAVGSFVTSSLAAVAWFIRLSPGLQDSPYNGERTSNIGRVLKLRSFPIRRPLSWRKLLQQGN
jgi:hypothetical protein